MAALDPALTRPQRWGVLAGFGAVVGLNQLLWLNFAPLIGLIEQRYGVSELTAGMLLLVFPLLYVVFSLHAGALADRRGYRLPVVGGAVVMAVFAWVRVFDGSFAALMIGQIGIAIAQPYVLNPISKIVTDWFPEEHAALANGLGTIAMFVGMMIGLAATPALVEASSLRTAMIVFAALTTAVAVVSAVTVKPNTQRRGAQLVDGPVRFGPLLRDRRLLAVFAIAFLGLGVFNGVTSWIEQIVGPNGISAVDAGLLGAVLVGAGIVGAGVIPAISDAVRRRKPFLVVCAALATASLYPLFVLTGFTQLAVAAGALGFFFMPAFALMLDICTRLAGTERAASATSVLMLAGNAGAVVLIVAMPMLRFGTERYDLPGKLCTALLGAAALLAATLPETFGPAVAPASVAPPAIKTQT